MAKITIDNKEYDTDALSDEAKNNIQNVQYCDQKIGELKREIALAQTARNAYVQGLKRALPKDA
jgi:pyoverdine/dityrosine biosynthesis protein Dit1